MSIRRLSVEDARRAAGRAVETLARDDRVELVYVFGSAAHATNVGPRDVDVAVLTNVSLDLSALMRLRADLTAATSAPIDLVSLNDAPIVLCHEVVESGRCLYARTPDAEIEFVTRARARYWDFKPFRDEQWRLAGERLAARRGSPA